VIGVVKDFHIASLHKPVEPVVLINFPFFYYTAGIKFSAAILFHPGRHRKSVQFSLPRQFIESEFLDEHVAGLYKDERRTQQLFTIFTFLSIAINILGLVGLLSFMIEQKTKRSASVKYWSNHRRYLPCTIKRFYPPHHHRISDCRTGCLVSHAQLAAGFRLPHIHNLVDFCCYRTGASP